MTIRTESLVMKLFSIFMVLFLSVATLFSTTGSYASGETFETSARSGQAEPARDFSLTTVRGTIHFAKRNTVVPMINDLIVDALTATTSFCEGNSCPRSNPYWAVIVDDGQRQYELHQPFAIGSPRAPSFVQVDGVTLRPGVKVALEGSIESISEYYGIISDVKHISVISSPDLPGQSMVDSIYGAEGTGWSCESLEDPSNGVNAMIWYGRKTVSSREAFHLRVIIKRLIDLARLQQGVTEISNVQMMQVAGTIVYQGTADDTAATLSIQQNSPLIRNYPSSLSIASMQGSLGVRMLCNPINGGAPIVHY